MTKSNAYAILGNMQKITERDSMNEVEGEVIVEKIVETEVEEIEDNSLRGIVRRKVGSLDKNELMTTMSITQKDAPNVITLIDVILQSANLERGFRQKKSHYPSGARLLEKGQPKGQCLRSQFYSWRGEQEREVDISGLWKMDLGNAIHEWIGDKLEVVLDNLTEEYPIKYAPDFLKSPISGRIDNLITDSPFGNFGIEIKSVYGKGLTNKYDGIKTNGPKDAHLMQAFIYLSVSRLPEEEKIKYMPLGEEHNRMFLLPPLDFFILYYIARDNAYRCQYVVDIVESEKVLESLSGILPEERLEKISKKKYVLTVTDGEVYYVYEDWSFKSIVESFMTVEKSVERETPPQRDYNLVYTLDEKNGEMVIDRTKSDWNCVPYFTKVMTQDGWRQIRFLQPKDKVLTRKGWKKIKSVIEKGALKEFVVIESALLPALCITEGHEVLVATIDETGVPTEKFVKSQDVNPNYHYLVYPITRPYDEALIPDKNINSRLEKLADSLDSNDYEKAFMDFDQDMHDNMVVGMCEGLNLSRDNYLWGNSLYSRVIDITYLFNNKGLQCFDLEIVGNPEFLTASGIIHNCSYCSFKEVCYIRDAEL